MVSKFRKFSFLWLCIMVVLTFTRESIGSSSFSNFNHGIDKGEFQYCNDVAHPLIPSHSCPGGKFKWASIAREREPADDNCACVQGLWKIVYTMHAGFDFIYGTNVRLDCFQLRENIEHFEYLGSGQGSSSPSMNHELDEPESEFTNEISTSVLLDLTLHSAFTETETQSPHNNNNQCHTFSIHSPGIIIAKTKISGSKNQDTCYKLNFPGSLTLVYRRKDIIKAKRTKILRKKRSLESIVTIINNQDCKNTSQVYIEPKYSEAEKGEIINEETIRILTDDTTRLLYNERLNITDDCQFKLIKRMAKNLRTLCPLNKRIYYAAIRMFKHLVLLDKVQYPRKTQLMSKCEWIEGILSNCTGNGTSIKGFDYRNVQHCYNKTVNISEAYKKMLGATPPCKCERLAITLKNETHPFFARNPNYTGPESLSYGIKVRDLPIETFWKTFLVNYHACEEGLGNNTFAIDQFYYQVRQMFSPRLIYRWENPGNSYEGYSVVFGHNNLMKFMSELDICLEYYHVTGAPRWWLYAPKNSNRLKRSLRIKSTEEATTELKAEKQQQQQQANNNKTPFAYTLSSLNPPKPYRCLL